MTRANHSLRVILPSSKDTVRDPTLKQSEPLKLTSKVLTKKSQLFVELKRAILG